VSEFPGQTLSKSISNRLNLSARITFAVTFVLIPVSFRLVLISRPKPPQYNDFTNFLFFAVDVAMLITLILWTIAISLSKKKLSFGPKHILIPLSGLLLAGWISSISSVDPQLSIYNSIRLILLSWFYLYIINEIRTVTWILIPAGLQVVIQAIVAIGQSIVQHSLGLQYLGEHLLDPVVPGISIVTSGGIRLLRAYGLSDHPNILGGSLAFALLILFSAYLNTHKSIPSLLVPLTLGFPALLVTFSRSAWLAFLGGAIFIIGALIIRRQWLAIKRLPWLLLLCIFLLAPFLLAYLRFFDSRLNINNSFNTPSVEQQSIGERFLLIDSSLPIFIKHPLFGVGLGASPQALQIAYPKFEVAYEPPHLALFDAALETGLLGVSFYLALMISPFVIFIRDRKSLLSNPITVTAVALLLSITIVGFFDYYTWLLIPGRLWQWTAWGFWAIAYQQKPGPAQIPSQVTA
jgi:O-antigen ligase